MNITNIALNTCIILFYAILLGVYFSKKNMNNFDNRLYRYSLIANIFLVLLHYIWLFAGHFMRGNLVFLTLLCNVYCCFMLLWFFFVSFYALIVSNENNEKFQIFYKKNYKKLINIVSFLLIIICFIILFLPTSIIYDDNGILLQFSGLNLIFTDTLVIIFIWVSIISVFLNRNNMNKKKLTPFILMAILGLINIVLMVIFPNVCVTVVLTTSINYLMFFTIENPDIELISQLTLAKSQAEKSNEAKSDFLSSMSHEIRTPLNAIVGISQMIKDSDDINQIKSDTDDLLVASQNLMEIVNGILDINKLEANQMEILESNYDLNKILEELKHLALIRIGDKDLDLRCNFSPNIPSLLLGDSGKIKNIILNLLTNAIKYTDSGVIYFSVDCENVKDRSNLVIRVKDTGRGISSEQLETIFTKFNRLDADRDSNIEGTGLGLAITKSLVDLFDGTIDVDSTLGEGSTFTVKLSQKIIEYKDNTLNSNNVEEVL